MSSSAARAHIHSIRGDERVTEKPSKTVIAHNGQTKVTLIGNWFFMDAAEIEREYMAGLAAGDPFFRNINNVLCSIRTNSDSSN
ncbi:hypothetical protein SD70_29715 [Gordoniibacillus kamchatkensis]|uniref:Uncharacterized protein n=1 Tax=Gordoniibacillus kamchatkensis TaxID=1590651 RepID=A0ABR5AAD0_9BACL|nr:hypothetical protein [Paenibacillus sp. VKM B-2647]KIL37963.1 hypothetical protein SD70_29715 [Paenibacillus sp. VKM B-2647]